MEYFRTADAQIQADFARRLGIILKQYKSLSSDSEKYEVTLTLTVLQSLLTNCVELLNKLDKKQKTDNPFYETPINEERWGIYIGNVLLNTYNTQQLNVNQVVRHVRNALSHPTKIMPFEKIQSTGYYTIQTESNIIEKICFVDSPDMNELNRRKTYSHSKAIELLNNSSANFPKNVEIQIIDEKKSAFKKEEKPFCRIFKITFSPKQLDQFAFALISYLSHPLIAEWDGQTFNINRLSA
jgi:hypothetical protein